MERTKSYSSANDVVSRQVLSLSTRTRTGFCAVAILAATFFPACTERPLSFQKAIPTPHPAQGAREAATAFYPDLAKPNSHFNRMFLDLYEERKKSDPESLASFDWPLKLARETANALGVSSKLDPLNRPPPETQPAEPVVPKRSGLQGTLLDRPAR